MLSLCAVGQGRSEARVPLTAGQKREVDDAFALFDYAKTGVLGLHEVKVRGGKEREKEDNTRQYLPEVRHTTSWLCLFTTTPEYISLRVQRRPFFSPYLNLQR